MRTVKVYDGATLLGSATAERQRRLELHHRGAANGAHSLTATATDAGRQYQRWPRAR